MGEEGVSLCVCDLTFVDGAVVGGVVAEGGCWAVGEGSDGGEAG